MSQNPTEQEVLLDLGALSLETNLKIFQKIHNFVVTQDFVVKQILSKVDRTGQEISPENLRTFDQTRITKAIEDQTGLLSKLKNLS